MGLVDGAFTKLKSNLEITQTEAGLASRRQNEIRDHICAYLALDRTFLTGSYARRAKTKKLKDVDIFCVLKPDGADAGLRQQSPWEVLTHLQSVLPKKSTAPIPEIGRRSCSVQFSAEDEVPSFDVVLAVDCDGNGYEIPDRFTGAWIATDPEARSARRSVPGGSCSATGCPSHEGDG